MGAVDGEQPHARQFVDLSSIADDRMRELVGRLLNIS